MPMTGSEGLVNIIFQEVQCVPLDTCLEFTSECNDCAGTYAQFASYNDAAFFWIKLITNSFILIQIGIPTTLNRN